MVNLDPSTWSDGIASYPVRQLAARARRTSATEPSAASVDLIRQLAARVHRAAQVRRGYIARERGVEALPPLTMIMRSGRGSAVRLRLHLSMLWIAAAPPHTITGSAGAWATVLDLAEPERKGARQVRSAMAWLESRQLVVTDSKAGGGTTITLLSDLGTGEPYSVPGKRLARAREEQADADRRDFYVQVPETFWTNGWVHNLSGAAVACLLLLLESRRGSDSEREIWFSQSVVSARYGLSEETRGKGLAELDAFGLITTSMATIRSDALGTSRPRHVYRIIDSKFDEPAWKL